MFAIEIFVGSSVNRILFENAKISAGTPYVKGFPNSHIFYFSFKIQ